MLIIHASQAFVKRFKCEVSQTDQRVAQPDDQRRCHNKLAGYAGT